MASSNSLQLETFIRKMRDLIEGLRKDHGSDDKNGLFQLIVETIDNLLVINDKIKDYSSQIYNYICKAGYFAEVFGAFLYIAKNATGYFTNKSGDSSLKVHIDYVLNTIDKRKKTVYELTKKMELIFQPLVELKKKLESEGLDAIKDLSFLDQTAQFNLCILELHLNIKTCQEELTKLDEEIDAFLAKKLGWAIGGIVGGFGGGIGGGAAATITTIVLMSNPIGWIIAGAAGATLAVAGLGFGIAGIVNSVQHSTNRDSLEASKVKISDLKAYFEDMNDNMKNSIKILQEMGIDIKDYSEY